MLCLLQNYFGFVGDEQATAILPIFWALAHPLHVEPQIIGELVGLIFGHQPPTPEQGIGSIAPHLLQAGKGAHIEEHFLSRGGDDEGGLA